MGILRTDKISGLETPTPVTGSVVFDGTEDYLDTTVEVLAANNFTFEMWINTSNTSTGYLTVFEYGQHNSSSNGIICQVRNTGGVTGIFTRNGTTDTSGAGISSPYPIKVGEWNHIAITRDGTTVRLHVNGIYTGSGTWSKDFTATDLRIASARYLSGEHFDGYISNFRMLKGTALYGSADFTVPAHELEVIGDTILLCCNNPDSAGADGTGKSITVNGDAAASSVSPGLTRDFTSGTEFRGVTTFDTQGYFVPPSGTTEQRGRGRGLFGGGLAPGRTNSIDYIQIQTQGNAQDFGDLTLARDKIAAASSATRGLFGGGDPGTNVINFVTIASTGDAVDFGDLTAADQNLGGAANNTRGLFFGGSPNDDTIQYVTIASLGNAQDFGDLTRDENDQRGCGSPIRCIIFERDASIDFVTFATTGNGTDFGDTIAENYNISACSDSTRGIRIGGGASPSTSNEYITIATTGNSQNFGDLTARSVQGQAVSDSKRGVISLGDDGSRTNAMDYITIQTTGNAQDFGDLTAPRDNGAACSDSHGGLG